MCLWVYVSMCMGVHGRHWLSGSWSDEQLWVILHEYWKLNAGPLQEQPALLPTDPSSSPWDGIFSKELMEILTVLLYCHGSRLPLSSVSPSLRKVNTLEMSTWFSWVPPMSSLSLCPLSSSKTGYLQLRNQQLLGNSPGSSMSSGPAFPMSPPLPQWHLVLVCAFCFWQTLHGCPRSNWALDQILKANLQLNFSTSLPNCNPIVFISPWSRLPASQSCCYEQLLMPVVAPCMFPHSPRNCSQVIHISFLTHPYCAPRVYE